MFFDTEAYRLAVEKVEILAYTLAEVNTTALFKTLANTIAVKDETITDRLANVERWSIHWLTQ